MSNQFDDDFAPIRISVLDATSNDIVKNARIDADQVMKVRKLTLSNSKHKGNISPSSKEPSEISMAKDLLTADGNKVSDHHRSTPSNINFTSAEKIIIKKVIKELQDKICVNKREWTLEHGWAKLIPSPNLSEAFKQIEDTLSSFMKPYELSSPIETRLLNLIDSKSKYVPAGKYGIRLALEKLKNDNSHFSFIVIDPHDVTVSVEHQILMQLISQLNHLDPTFLNTIRNSEIYGGLMKHIIDLIEYSDETESLEKNLKKPKRTLLLFIDSSKCLYPYYQNIINQFQVRRTNVLSVYIKLSNGYEDGYKNINCQSYITEETKYSDEVIQNLKIISNNNNLFVDLFNDMITDKSDSTHKVLRSFILNEIKSCYQFHINSMDCSQGIIKYFVSQVK